MQNSESETVSQRKAGDEKQRWKEKALGSFGTQECEIGAEAHGDLQGCQSSLPVSSSSSVWLRMELWWCLRQGLTM